MKFSLSERLEAWSRLLAKRDDLEFTWPLKVGEPVEPPSDYPDELKEIAKHFGTLLFSYRYPKVYGAAGFLCLGVDGERVPTYFELDGEVVPDEALYIFDGDLEGTGSATWLIVRDGKPATIAYSVEDTIEFSSAERYLTKGAKRAFEYGDWQRTSESDGPPPLASVSMSPTTPLEEIHAALVARGASVEMATDLIEWLGTDVVLVLPK